MVPIASSPRLLMKYVRNTRSPSRKNTLWPCHSSTPKSESKLSVRVYHGISQPIRAFRRMMSACGARDAYASVVSRAFRWARLPTWSAPREQPRQACSGHPNTNSCSRAAAHSCGDTIGGVFIASGPPLRSSLVDIGIMASCLSGCLLRERGQFRSSDASRSNASRRAALFPAVELDIVWMGRAFSGFEKRLQAQQKDRPLGAAVVHELHRLLPTLLFEEDDGPVAFLPEIPTYLCANPFCGSVDHLPQHVLGGLKLKNLHVDTAGHKAELDHSADFPRLPLRVACPPPGKTFDRGQRLIGIIQGRRFDSDFMQNIWHIPFLLYCC